MPLLSEKQALERLGSTEFDSGVVSKVTEKDGWINVETKSFGFSYEDKYGRIPSVGDSIRVYVRLGSYVRGLDINNMPVFFKTDEELDAERIEEVKRREKEAKDKFKKNKASLDEQYKSLPPIFRKRIRWFRKHNKDFRWKFESYEMFACVEAIKIAEKCGTPQAVQDFMNSTPDFQRSFVPDLSDAHSGNSFGMSCRLAYNYLEDEEMVFFEHGALTPLVGCTEYGCVHPRPGIERFAKEKGWGEDDDL